MQKKSDMKGYKGFDKGLTCRGKQYEVGRTEHEEDATLCQKGLHFCENPHEVFGYYSAGEGHRFCEVSAKDVSDERETESSKRVCKTLKVEAEISVFQICKIAVRAFFENFNFKEKVAAADANNAGNYGAANAGDCGAANAGNCGAANAGDYGAANAGDYGAANAGYKGAANAGNCGAANAGNCGAASVGYNGVAVVSTKGRAKGGKGSILVLVNRDEYNKIVEFKAVQVDGVEVKADTWYRLENGNLVEDEQS